MPESIRVGSAPDSWGVWYRDDPRQIPWPRFLDEVAQAGYHWTELGPLGYLPLDHAQLRRELSRRQLQLAGGFVMRPLEGDWFPIQRDVDAAGRVLSELGAKFLVLIDDLYGDNSASAGGERLEDDQWARLLEATHKVADRASRLYGLRTVFHPHAQTHVEAEDQIERFLQETDAQAVGLCLDTGHHAYCGGDPVSFLKRHSDRIEYLHLKNVDPVILRRVTDSRKPFPEAVASDVFCELSTGAVRMSDLLMALTQIGFAGYAIVEQDMYPAPFDRPLPIMTRTREYLRDLGLG